MVRRLLTLSGSDCYMLDVAPEQDLTLNSFPLMAVNMQRVGYMTVPYVIPVLFSMRG